MEIADREGEVASREISAAVEEQRSLYLSLFYASLTDEDWNPVWFRHLLALEIMERVTGAVEERRHAREAFEMSRRSLERAWGTAPALGPRSVTIPYKEDIR